jgi:hypothetical protein
MSTPEIDGEGAEDPAVEAAGSEQEAPPATAPEEGDEPAVEKAETLRLPLGTWVRLWGVPLLVVIVVLVIVIALTNP